MKVIQVGNVYTKNGIPYVVDRVSKDDQYDNRIVEVVLRTSTNGSLTILSILSADGAEFGAITQTFVGAEMFKPYLSESMMAFSLKIIKYIKAHNKRLSKKGGKQTI